MSSPDPKKTLRPELKPAETPAVVSTDMPRSSPLGRTWRRLTSEPSGILGLVLVVVLILVGLVGPIIVTHDPMAQSLRDQYLKPGTEGHLLGTDDLGRDLLSRTVAGARISLTIGIFVSLLSAFIGILAGSLAGYFLGWIDTVMMRIVDLLLAFPRLILAIAVLAVAQQPSLFLVFLVLSLTGWASIARLVRGQVMQAKTLEFVQAARALGAGHNRVMILHIFPHIAGVVIIWITLAVPSTIMAEAGLSFLGLGAKPGVPSWGMMIAESRNELRNEWWIPMIPGIALAITVLGFNLLGDALQDALNPRLRKE